MIAIPGEEDLQKNNLSIHEKAKKRSALCLVICDWHDRFRFGRTLLEQRRAAQRK
jgi:hypothetical protein